MASVAAKSDVEHAEAMSTGVGVVDSERDLNHPEELKGGEGLNLRLDKHGLPLSPQPTSHKDDPLVSS